MEEKLQDIKFKYKFRDYQEQTLTMLDKYLHDRKIHVVAAPGAGKTILALELLLRIGKKTLILVPTIAIKEQWVERLKKDFINGDKEELVSTDLENPKIITVITYQYLYSLNRKKIDIKNILVSNNIGTVILDEAHHLRKVWFRTLDRILDQLEEVTTISLTATPPYDNGNDFSNYMNLCGEIDAKITIPQLVKSNCLCPHQDYIYFNIPTEDESIRLKRYKAEVDDYINQLKINENFIKAIALNDLILNTEENVDNILKEFDLYIAMISFLTEVGVTIPFNQFNNNIEIPFFTRDMMKIILEKYIFDSTIQEVEIFEETFKKIKQDLKLIGCIEEKNVNLEYTKDLENLLLKNAGKLDSINEIIRSEIESLNNKLKLVIVTDFIRNEFYDVQDVNSINEIGVMPIFRKTIDKFPGINIIMLTGELVIIPTAQKELLFEIAKAEYNIDSSEIYIEEIGIDFNYSKVTFEGRSKRYLVNIITKLFEKLDTSVLVGTVALIGEGWDAPFVNSLIMATYVSSYVTSNQVRGRAIRIDKKNPNKIANIWHLVCMEQEKDNTYILGKDFEILSKRFWAYDGLDIKQKSIEAGIERLNINIKPYSNVEISGLNNRTIFESNNRDNIKRLWDIALKNYIPTSNEKIPIERLYKNKSGRVRKSSKGMAVLSEACIDLGIIAASTTLMVPELLLGVAVNRYLFNEYLSREERYIKRACKAIFRAMKQKKLISQNARYYVHLIGEKIEFGLTNAYTYEQMIFIKSVKQSITLDENSRYIIKLKDNVYSVPELFAKNKEDAEVFFKHMNKGFSGKLIYTKSEQGKKLLLKYKMNEYKKGRIIN